MFTIGQLVAFIYPCSVYQWALDGVLLEKLKTPASHWGLIALICMDMLFFFSTEFWRKRAYNVFLTTHIVGFSLVLPAVSSFLLRVPIVSKTNWRNASDLFA